MFRCLQIKLIAGLLFFVAASQVQAQRVPGYSQRPTVSPYINLFNSNQGGVNNYFSFVRPLQQQAQFNQQQLGQNFLLQQQLNQQPYGQYGTGQVGRQQISLGIQPAGQQPLFRPAAQGMGVPQASATYFNYSHFYPVPQTQRRFRTGQ